jgi:hypothetical protein
VYINQQWKKALAVGCLHSAYACPVAMDNVMALVEDLKPDERVDLGDLHDFAALRKGASGGDELTDLTADYDLGIRWLKRFRPTKRCHGNHDHRMYKLLNDPRGKLALLAKMVVDGIRSVDEENGTEVKPYHQRRGWFQFGDTLGGHGYMAGAHGMRDHAETFGNCVIAHLHVAGSAAGRTRNRARCYCVGTMVDPDNAEYAVNFRNWNAWQHGAAEIEYTDTQSHVRLYTAFCNHGGPEVWA